MRSRYCAFAMGDLDYLTKTHHPSQRVNDNKAIAATMANTQWHGLQIVKTAAGNSIAEGYVEFIARYSEDNQPGVLHENSRFVNEDDCWFYIDGDIIESGPIKPPSRNEPCWCGSSKKFKKCHG
jgi:SEC-C motif-containing protein